MFKTGGGIPNLLSTSLDERLAAMGALIEPLPCRFDCDHEYETAVSSGTQVIPTNIEIPDIPFHLDIKTLKSVRLLVSKMLTTHKIDDRTKNLVVIFIPLLSLFTVRLIQKSLRASPGMFITCSHSLKSWSSLVITKG
ncbi:hypothetical protein TNCT_446481 [Trichonephila clavata]|uniref:Uncharacterized protein n=1 Tax=Trichonephila clavata TaxID=2740835 RepID=A0A8X6FLG1_TRICU|nr:hypothetical protein TNCT_446481 [Trichonephila clavata]